jgi:sulfopyruvate decarboxylase TPP-binding subunit
MMNKKSHKKFINTVDKGIDFLYYIPCKVFNNVLTLEKINIFLQR